MPLNQSAKSRRRIFAEVVGSVLFVSVLTIVFYQYYSHSDARSYGGTSPELAASVAAYVSPPPSSAPTLEADRLAVSLPHQIQPPLRTLYQESDPVEPDAGVKDNYAPNDR